MSAVPWALTLLLATPPAAEPAAVTDVVLEDFQNGIARWESRYPLQSPAPEYTVQFENGNAYLHAAPPPGVRGNAFYVRAPISVRETPRLRWRWRVGAFPAGADEDKRGANDSAAAVYVYFEKGLLRRVLKYVWSASHAEGEWIAPSRSSVFWKMKIKVQQSGPPLGAWVQEEVNLVEDYRTAFGGEPPQRAGGIGVMTDADQTKSPSVGDYDDFTAAPENETPPPREGGAP